MPTVRSAAPSHALRSLLLLLVSSFALTLGVVAPSAANAADTGLATTTTLRPDHATVAYGYHSTLTVVTRRASDSALINGTVVLYRRASSTASWQYVSSATTRSGVAKLSYTATRTWTWRASFTRTDVYARSTSSLQTVTVAAGLGSRAVTEASRHAGAPYQYGAEGPTRFDCSGFTRYVFGRFGKSLPHNSGQQYSVVRHIAKSSMRVGDLIFIYDGGSIHHVGIYAGNGYIWHSPKSGDVVRKSKLWTSAYYVGRVG